MDVVSLDYRRLLTGAGAGLLCLLAFLALRVQRRRRLAPIRAFNSQTAVTYATGLTPSSLPIQGSLELAR